MTDTKRLIIKSLPKGWVLRKNHIVQDGSRYNNFSAQVGSPDEYRWAVVNEYGRIIIVGKTLERILEQLEGVNDDIYLEELEEYELAECGQKGYTDND